MKTLLGILVLAVSGWLLFALVAPEGRKAQARTFQSSRDCRDCHSAIFAEWESSQHAISWTNPAVRHLSNDFANQDCIDCHAPQPIFVTGVGERVLPRATRRVEGVDCIACHQLPEHADGSPGGMAGSVANDGVACQPEQRRELVRPDFCAGCHNQHKTVDQWQASSFAAEDRAGGRQDCSDCHMPWIEDEGGRHRSHRFPGGDVLAMVQKAVTLTGAEAEGDWQLTLTNVWGGHSFPTDERSRAADIFWRPLAEGGEPGPWRHLHRMRSPYRTEAGVEETLLLADETRVIWVTEDSDGTRGTGQRIAADQAIEAALFYKRSPYWLDPEQPDPDNEAQLVHRVELRP